MNLFRKKIMISFLTILSILFIFPHISNAFVHYGRGYYH